MQTLIKEIIKDKRVVNALKNIGVIYAGQLLILSREDLLKVRNVGTKGIFVILDALAKHKYLPLGSVKAHELPSVVLLHMAELSAQREAAKAAAEEDKDDFGYFEADDNSNSIADEYDFDDL